MMIKGFMKLDRISKYSVGQKVELDLTRAELGGNFWTKSWSILVFKGELHVHSHILICCSTYVVYCKLDND